MDSAWVTSRLSAGAHIVILLLLTAISSQSATVPLATALLRDYGRRTCITRMRKEYITSIQPFIRRGQPVVLLDIATHSNLGDNFIVLGQQMFLATVGATVTHICDKCTLSVVAQAVGNGTILLHGGGNFGDVWRRMTLFRNDVVKRFPDNAIVFLPQDVFYGNNQTAVMDAKIYAQHKHLHMFARNIASQEVLDDYFPDTPHTICPDAAFVIGPIVPNCEPIYDVVFLIRNDKEAVTPKNDFAAAQERLTALNKTFVLRSWDQWRNYMPLLGRSSIPMERLPLYRINAGNSMLCQGRVIITDRLHGMILSILIGRPAVVMDNSYGKVSGYRRSHLTPDPDCSEENLRSFLVTKMSDAVTKGLKILDEY